MTDNLVSIIKRENCSSPIDNADYFSQGWEAARAGYGIDDCPYQSNSDAEMRWKNGYNED